MLLTSSIIPDPERWAGGSSNKSFQHFLNHRIIFSCPPFFFMDNNCLIIKIKVQLWYHTITDLS